MMQKTKFIQFLTSDKTITLLVLIAAAFFALFKLTSIPPGTQNDVIRSVLTAEQFLNKLDGDGTSLRQIIAYFFNGGYWTYSFIDIFRSNLNITAINIISRLPAAIFCIFTSITWLNMLRLLKVHTRSIALFFLIFLPSSLFLTYSHHIPLVAGYFFFTSASMYYLLKFISSPKQDLQYLAISLITAAIATYTHGISIFFITLFYFIFMMFLLIFHRDTVRDKIRVLSDTKIKSTLTVSLTVIITGIILIPFFLGIFGSDRSLQIRDATTIKYLIENDEYSLIAQKGIEKIKAYLHPNTLVFSGDIVEGEQPISSPEFFDIKNAPYNQWVTTHLSPFGAISAIIYLIVPFALGILILNIAPKEGRLTYVFFLTLAFTYLLLPLFPNYDNPSVAKSITALMFIPLGISLLSSFILQGEKKKYIWYALLIPVLINAGYNLTYMYSNEYQVNERAKYYQYNTVQLADDIADTPALHNTRIFLTVDNIDLQNALSFYLSPYILNRVVYGPLHPELIDDTEYSLVITQSQEDLVTISEYGYRQDITRYTYPDGSLDYMLVRIEPTTTPPYTPPFAIDPTGVTCTHEPFYPFYTGEMEYLIYQYRYYAHTDSVHLENCINEFPREYRLLDTRSLDRSNRLLTTSVAPDIWGTTPSIEGRDSMVLDDKTRVSVDNTSVSYIFPSTSDITKTTTVHTSEQASYTHSSLTLTAGEQTAKASISIPPDTAGEGTYLLEFKYEKDPFSFIDLFIIDENSAQNIAINLLAQDYDPIGKIPYTTIFYVPEVANALVGIDLYNRHLNIDKSAHPVHALIENITVTKLSSLNLLDVTYTQEKEQSEYQYSSTPTVTSFIPGITKVSHISKGDQIQTVVLNQPFSNTNIALGNGASSYRTLVNGIAQGIQTEASPEREGTVLLINIGWFIGLIYFTLFLSIPLFLVVYGRKRS